MAEAKPFGLPKRWVWEAYKRVRGAAGVDGQSLADFEKDLEGNLYDLEGNLYDLEGNLYKVWNRMWSGSCFRLRCTV